MSEHQHDAPGPDAHRDVVPAEDASVPEAGAPGQQAHQAPDLSAVAPTEAAEPTGNPVVDGVLDSLRELEHLPPAEHVALFEAAHDRLRGALADAGEPPAES